MTIGQLLECVTGKVSALEVYYTDATPFNEYNIEEAMDKLEKHGSKLWLRNFMLLE